MSGSLSTTPRIPWSLGEAPAGRKGRAGEGFLSHSLCALCQVLEVFLILMYSSKGARHHTGAPQVVQW